MEIDSFECGTLRSGWRFSLGDMGGVKSVSIPIERRSIWRGEREGHHRIRISVSD